MVDFDAERHKAQAHGHAERVVDEFEGSDKKLKRSVQDVMGNSFDVKSAKQTDGGIDVNAELVDDTHLSDNTFGEDESDS
jgi:hypothetical protein